MKKAHSKPPRGYMLIEALVASALLGTMLVTTVHMIGVGERSLAFGSRRSLAHAALRDGVVSYSSRSYYHTSMSVGTKETNARVNGMPVDVMKRNIRVETAPSSECNGCKAVRVEVLYKDLNGRWKTITESAWVHP
ncbi:MAG: hypothetical protein AB2A00_25725 [Myxococcota bacterium]